MIMSEYIEREAAYEDFEKCNSENPKWTPSRVKALIARQKAADVSPVSHGRWIPVTERLPDEHESLFARYKGTDKWFNGMFMTISDPVIVCAECENGERIVKTANTTEGIWKVKDSFYPCRVTHWQPLPEPPKEVPENETL